jgi:hypothetical protein
VHQRLYPRASFCYLYFFRSEIGLYRPTFHRHIVVHTPRMRLSLHLPRLQCRSHGQATIAGGAIRCRSSWHSIRVRAYCHFRADTIADVAERRLPSAFQLPRLPSPSVAHRPAAVISKKLVILYIRAPSLMLWALALLHVLDHVHLDLGNFGTKGLSSA